MTTGSTWRKWDLHFHTPSSYDYENKSVTNQEIIDTLYTNNVEVVAITDHHVIDIFRIKELQSLGMEKVTVLPGIEFRAELGGSDSIHFIGIFPENCDIEDVWIKLQSGCGLTTKDISDKGGDPNIHCDLKDTSKLIHQLGGLVSVHAGAKSNTIENITNTLPYKMALKTDLVINHIDILELGNENDQKVYTDIVFPSISNTLPMIICTDNHNIKSYSAKQNLWIKGDPSFEGLKQILFEQKYRVHLGENPPINPPIRINKVSLDFPADATFENEVFCVAGKRDLDFSSNFTCLIGGRGTGKSTILNLIHEKLRPGENRFFKEKKVRDVTGTIIPIESSVIIDNDVDEKYIEFLSQNEVEEFAQDYQKLTAAIYSRLLKLDKDGMITQNETQLNEHLKLLKHHIIDKKRISALQSEFAQKQKELEANKKIIESFSSEEYTQINNDLKSITTKLNSISSSHEEFKLILQELETLVESHNQDNAENLYAKEIAKIVAGVEKLISDSKTTDFSTEEKTRVDLTSELNAKKEELKQYLSDKGLTAENQKDIAYANVIASNLEEEIKRKQEEIDDLQKRINNYDKTFAETASGAYKQELEKQIKSISEILEKLENTAVKPISLHLEFDIDAAKEMVFSEFKSVFEGPINQSNHKGDGKLKEILFCIAPNELTDKETLIESIRAYYTTSAAKTFLLELLSKDRNFNVYKLVAEWTFLDYSLFKKIKVQYDNRPIESSSFGQRCTAVLVILLLLGNNPIIIDEPEAHLDSLLISNYLVEVIKDRKQNRQIIFATHNANFVINGDTELIHILNIDEITQTTKVTSTTIENAKTRETLIGLEGGREAFRKREFRYQ